MQSELIRLFVKQLGTNTNMQNAHFTSGAVHKHTTGSLHILLAELKKAYTRTRWKKLLNRLAALKTRSQPAADYTPAASP